MIGSRRRQRLTAPFVLGAVVALVATVAGPAGAQPTPAPPAPTTTPSPEPPPPPPPPQSGTRVVAGTVTDDGDDLALRVVVFEQEVAGVDGGWSVTASAQAGQPATVTSEAVTITGDGGVPSSSASVGDEQRAATLFTVAGQQAGALYRARYLAFGRASFPAGREGKPVVVVTLIQ